MHIARGLRASYFLAVHLLCVWGYRCTGLGSARKQPSLEKPFNERAARAASTLRARPSKQATYRAPKPLSIGRHIIACIRPCGSKPSKKGIETVPETPLDISRNYGQRNTGHTRFGHLNISNAARTTEAYSGGNRNSPVAMQRHAPTKTYQESLPRCETPTHPPRPTTLLPYLLKTTQLYRHLYENHKKAHT